MKRLRDLITRDAAMTPPGVTLVQAVDVHRANMTFMAIGHPVDLTIWSHNLSEIPMHHSPDLRVNMRLSYHPTAINKSTAQVIITDLGEDAIALDSPVPD